MVSVLYQSVSQASLVNKRRAVKFKSTVLIFFLIGAGDFLLEPEVLIHILRKHVKTFCVESSQ